MSSTLLSRGFLWLILVQGFHFLEHCVQVAQRFWLNDPNGNGLLGSLANVELVHFGYNSFFLLGLVWLFFQLSLATDPVWAHNRWVLFLVGAAVAVQSYHEMEHVLRLGQAIGWLPVPPSADLTATDPPGLLGRWVNDVLLHWVLNGIVEALPVAAFVAGHFQSLLNASKQRVNLVTVAR